MNRVAFRQRIKQGPLLLDGAMGTVLNSRGIGVHQCFDAVHRQDPAIVADIHRAYIDAGADIIETNTFGANRFKLNRHGLADDVAELNRQAVSVARRVIDGSFKSVLLAGSVGPLGVRLAPLGRVSVTEAESAFAEQIDALIGAVDPSSQERGVDLIVLETMPDVKEIAAAVSAARSLAPDLPIVGMITFTRDDRTILGDTPSDVAEALVNLDLDVVGINCGGGPAQVLRMLAIFATINKEMPLAAVPNAGWPQQQEGGRLMYPASAEYFANYAQAFVKAGASIIGGCCGTTAEHIAAMRRALDAPDKYQVAIPSAVMSARSPVTSMAADRPTELREALQEGRFVITVEMGPPRGIAAQPLLASARMLREAGAGFVNIADSPLARMRMSAWAAAHLVQRQVGVETVLHFPTRGRNLLRIQGDLLAAHALGIRNLFVVMGDPTQIGDFPEAMDDYDIVPSGLIRLIKRRLNSGVDQSGQPIDQPTSFTVGCALNVQPQNLTREIKLLHKKITNGADFALTQPVFDPRAFEAFLSAYKSEYGPVGIPIVAGVQPLYSSANARFLHNEVPGITIPESLRDRLQEAGNQQREGVQITLEIVEALQDHIQGIYVIPAFGRYDLVADVIEGVRKRL